jgi:hypothetical protein
MLFAIVTLYGAQFLKYHAKLPAQSTSSTKSLPAIPQYTTPAGFVRKTDRPIEDDVKTILKGCKDLERNLKLMNYSDLISQGMTNACEVLQKTIGELELKPKTSKSWWKTLSSFIGFQLFPLSWPGALIFMGLSMWILGMVVFIKGFSRLSARDRSTVLTYQIGSGVAFLAAVAYSNKGLVYLLVMTLPNLGTLWLSLYHLVDEKVDEAREVQDRDGSEDEKKIP